eukprot:8984422-Heterocapsa_arctica.AAC.1
MGAVGAVQRALHAQARCLEVHIDRFAAVEIDPNVAIWPWLVRHAAWLIERFHVRSKEGGVRRQWRRTAVPR